MQLLLQSCKKCVSFVSMLVNTQISVMDIGGLIRHINRIVSLTIGSVVGGIEGKVNKIWRFFAIFTVFQNVTVYFPSFFCCEIIFVGILNLSGMREQ